MATRKLTRADLYSLEKYAEMRNDFRGQVMEHKKSRQVQIGPHVRLYFEDRLTIQYQVQEMLRAERVFEAAGIEDELAAYNPLIPDGSNWKATLMLEYPDMNERQSALQKLKGVENRAWVQVAGFEPVFAIADEDLERENETKTSSVHFLRFELTPGMVQSVKRGADIAMGVDHAACRHRIDRIAPAVRDSLASDLS